MIADVLDELGIEYKTHGEHHHTTEGWTQIDCAWCSPDSGRFRFGIPNGGWIGNCFSCGKHPIAETLIETSDRPAKVVLALLYANRKEGGKGQWITDSVGKFVPPRMVGPLEEAHTRYLKGRKIDVEEAMEWGVGGIGLLGDRLKWRRSLPIRQSNRPVSWTTRSISDRASPRYVSASKDQEAIPHKTLLYGAEWCLHAALICEGPMDALRVGKGAVATFGSAYTPSQVLRMARFPVRVVAFDSEPLAQQQAGKLCEELSLFPGETIKVTLKAKDPGSCSPGELKELRRMLV